MDGQDARICSLENVCVLGISPRLYNKTTRMAPTATLRAVFFFWAG
jgi:hypothetical protein